MAIYHLKTEAVARSKGQSAVAASAYRARCQLADERTGTDHDYSRAKGLQFAGIFAPVDAPAWARDRAKLWNRAELADTRSNSRPARDIEVALPHELTAEQNRYLVQDFVREQFVRKGLVADVAIHEPHSHGDDRNVHAHILITTRQLAGDGFAKDKLRDLNDKAELQKWREAWERTANRHLKRHGHEAVIDHRSLAEQGVDRTPTVHLGKQAAALERRGLQTNAGDHNRAVIAQQQRDQANDEPTVEQRREDDPARDLPPIGRPENRDGIPAPENDNHQSHAADRRQDAPETGRTEPEVVQAGAVAPLPPEPTHAPENGRQELIPSLQQGMIQLAAPGRNLMVLHAAISWTIGFLGRVVEVCADLLRDRAAKPEPASQPTPPPEKLTMEKPQAADRQRDDDLLDIVRRRIKERKAAERPAERLRELLPKDHTSRTRTPDY